MTAERRAVVLIVGDVDDPREALADALEADAHRVPGVGWSFDTSPRAHRLALQRRRQARYKARKDDAPTRVTADATERPNSEKNLEGDNYLPPLKAEEVGSYPSETDALLTRLDGRVTDDDALPADADAPAPRYAPNDPARWRISGPLNDLEKHRARQGIDAARATLRGDE